MEAIRLDKYLWAVRIFKTRSDAAEAIRQNRVLVNDAYAKPSREVRIGDRIAVKRMPVTYLFEVVGYVSSRQPAKNVPDYCRNITPQSELDKLNIPVVGYVSSRQPAKNVPDYCRNITPQSELDKLNIPRETVFVFRDRGTGRPTKKERRELDNLMEEIYLEEEEE